jgi:class 3 adenylate cyclase
VLLAEGDAAGAAGELRAAVSAWRQVEAPYEIARSRALLGAALLALGDAEAADLELGAARAEFQRLGATVALAGVERTIAAAAERRAAPVHVHRTFMFTDIEDSTGRAEELGDAAWRDLLQKHDDALQAQFQEHRGKLVNSTGDGFFVAFDSAADALACARAIQAGLAQERQRNRKLPEVRIGLHAADATRRGDDFSGVGVHVAARVAAIAGGGEIVATAATLAEADASAGSDIREVSLKGVSTPIKVATVAWR